MVVLSLLDSSCQMCNNESKSEPQIGVRSVLQQPIQEIITAGLRHKQRDSKARRASVGRSVKSNLARSSPGRGDDECCRALMTHTPSTRTSSRMR